MGSIADEVILHVKGPRAGITILMDEVKLRKYVDAESSCTQLVKNPNAENEDLLHWKVYGDGYFQFVVAGLDEGLAYMLTARTHFSDGIKQDFDMDCFDQVGEIFEVNGLFQLIDDEGIPYACDKSAPWTDPQYCILMTIEMQTSSGTKRQHYGNAINIPWVAEALNPFTRIFTVTAELSESTSAFFFFQGPQAGASIVFDHVTITSLEATS